jgi:hypothetical protein
MLVETRTLLEDTKMHVWSRERLQRASTRKSDFCGDYLRIVGNHSGATETAQMPELKERNNVAKVGRCSDGVSEERAV